ncbi:MAG: beta-lactamase [Bacteroidetes bacterium]|nr:MAG: beta-lactamase [Bacteroidota bacterium]
MSHMKIEQLYTKCLSEAAYYIESEGEAAVIDPLRETAPYIALAEAGGAKIKYVFETHFHADFVSGHLDLAKKTGAEIVYGPGAEAGFPCTVAGDGELFPIGKIRIKVLHTPGHTFESSCFLLIDEDGKEKAVFTGDTLFIGDVGRPDLAIKGLLTEKDLAALLYDSIHEKLLPLPDDIIVYPGHGAGSACGKMISNETTDTIGHQKQTNYALLAKTKDDFVKAVTSGLMPPPQYFPKNARLNKTGYESIDVVMDRALHALSPETFALKAKKQQALVLDVRPAAAFAESFIPGAVNIGLDGQFAPWAGTLITDMDRPILLVVPEGKAEETALRLARVGYDHVIGYLSGGMEAWEKAGFETDSIRQVSPNELATLLNMSAGLHILDVRRQSEFDSEHIMGVSSFPLDHIHRRIDELDKRGTYYIHCAAGYRSMIAASILRAAGFRNVINVTGGFQAIKDSKLVQVSEYKIPTTML